MECKIHIFDETTVTTPSPRTALIKMHESFESLNNLNLGNSPSEYIVLNVAPTQTKSYLEISIHRSQTENYTIETSTKPRSDPTSGTIDIRTIECFVDTKWHTS